VVGAVETVVQSQSVPVHGGFQVPVVGGVHHHLGALPHHQCGSGDRPVVGQHPDRVFADLLDHRGDPQGEDVTVGQLDGLGRDVGGQACGVSAERIQPGGVLPADGVRIVGLRIMWCSRDRGHRAGPFPDGPPTGLAGKPVKTVV